jgi:Fe-S cluster assembly ATPase SufC
MALPAEDAAQPALNEVVKEGVIFAVMGTTGSGKSTFIQKASGHQNVPVGHGLKSCT